MIASTKKVIGKFALFSLLGLAAVQACAVDNATNTSIEKPTFEPVWTYSEDKDPMRGTVNKMASLPSVNNGYFSPYMDLPQQLGLVVRNKPGKDGLNVFMSVVGRIECASGGCKVPLKFDDGPVLHLSATPSEKGYGFFFRDPQSFVRRLKASKTMMVEVSRRGQSDLQFTFATEGLQW